MCSIVGSFDRFTTIQLIELNQFRGNFSHSYTEIEDNKVVLQAQSFGEFNMNLLLDTRPDIFRICHVQSPTGGMTKDFNRIHPVNINGNMLWHNGLLTPRGIAFLQEKLGTIKTFDTELLLEAILRYGYDILSEIEGLFSCVLLRDGELTMFRSKHGKLYVDDKLNISSERFPDSKCINADTIYNIDLESKTLLPVHKFKTKRFNFVIPGEL